MTRRAHWVRWTRDGAMHFDAQRYAELRGIDTEAAAKELEEMARKLLPDATVTVTDDPPPVSESHKSD